MSRRDRSQAATTRQEEREGKKTRAVAAELERRDTQAVLNSEPGRRFVRRLLGNCGCGPLPRTPTRYGEGALDPEATIHAVGIHYVGGLLEADLWREAPQLMRRLYDEWTKDLEAEALAQRKGELEAAQAASREE